MKKLTKYQLTKVSKNLDNYFNIASNEDITNGLQWYKQANAICNDIAIKHNTTTFIASGVISALSPRNKWDKNIIDAYAVFNAIDNNIEPTDLKVSTFHTNKFKAFAIARELVEITTDSLKTYSFCQNIAHLNNDFITVDVWHLRACFNKTMASVGTLAYEQIRKLTIRKANEVGMNGFEYQAIIWNSVKTNF